MKATLFTFTTWFVSDPRRMAAVLLAMVVLMALVAALVPTDVAVAGEITSGS